ncbi:MAG: hypothetical protein ACK5IA_09850, partial [Cyanobacteriota bacterium]
MWLYLYLVNDGWSRKVVAWDVAEREYAQIAADLVGRASLRERISRRRPQPLILHADNGNAMRAATLKARVEELGGVQILFQASCERRQPLLGGAVPHGQV